MKHELTIALPRFYQCDAYNDFSDNYPLIDKICRYAEQISAPDILHYFSSHFSGNLPIAPITGYADGLDTTQGFWLRADPVDFQTDINSAYFFGIRHLDMNLRQARCIADEIRPIIEDYGFELHVPTVYRWYLKLPEAVVIKTPAPETMMGANVRDYLTEVDISWRKMFTEVQMAMKICEVNLHLKREVTGLWFWGGGYLPSLPKLDYQEIIGDNAVSKGIAKLAQVTYKDVQHQQFANVKQLSQVLIVMDNHIIAISKVLPALYQALRLRRLQKLNLYLGNQTLYQLSARQVPARWQFWHKS